MSHARMMDESNLDGTTIAGPVSLAAAQAWCRRLARSHYENFTVGSWFLPRRLRQHFYNLYAYCRCADDLADETGDSQESLRLLEAFGEQLRAMYRGAAREPVFVALHETAVTFGIPIEPFADLLTAFRQDQRQTRYANHDEVLAYCKNSANPVGRLVLYLGRCHEAQSLGLSDSICTGLQLANFCQDVARDWRRGRVYLPQDALHEFGYTAEMFAREEYNPAFRRLLASEVGRAETYLKRGLPLVGRVPRELRGDVRLFAQGGLAVLDGIRRIDYNVWKHRPVVSKSKKLRLLWKCFWA